MFQSFSHAKIPILETNAQEDAWAYLELMLNTSFFFVECCIYEDDLSFYTSYLFSDPLQLSELTADKDISIVALYLISPPFINSTKFWSMEKINQICRGFVYKEEYQIKIDIYELSNGQIYYSNNCEPEHIKNIDIVFPNSSHLL